MERVSGAGPLGRFIAAAVDGPTHRRTVQRTRAGRVVEVSTPDGRRWFAKRFRLTAMYDAEVRAYRDWVWSIQPWAPALVAADRELRSILVTALPGRRPRPLRPHHLEQAGALLRAFHDSAPPRTGPVVHRLWDQLEEQIVRCRGVGVAVDATWLRRHVAAAVDGIDALPVVPCHGDFQPHNWLVADDGRLRVLDFGRAYRHAAAVDITRLVFGPAWHHPSRLDTFLRGYGRGLEESERAFVTAQLTVNALVALTRGTRNNRPSVHGRGRAVLDALRSGLVLDLGPGTAGRDRTGTRDQPRERIVTMSGERHRTSSSRARSRISTLSARTSTEYG